MVLVKHSERTVRKPCRSCGRSDLYWAHDTDRIYHKACPRCEVTGSFVLIERDGSRHNCRNTTDGTGDPAPDMELDGPTEDEDREAPSVPAPVSPDVQTALGMLVGALTPQVDRAEIEAMVKEAVANVVFPTRTVVERANGERKEFTGATHHKLGDVIISLMAGEHVLMVGPAGTGKSTIAEQAAEGLGLKSYSISLSPQTPASQLLGYMQATGDYVPSLFREAYEHGGLFHFDEMDNAHPSVLAVMNAALANGHMAFPDQMVKRHPDFRAVASANTYGRGATRSYVGRQAIDAATLDRFSVETIEVDETLENELCHSTGLEIDQVEQVLTFVRGLRANAEAHSMPVVISPRASVGMCRLLAAGRSWESAVQARVRRGMGDTEWNKING
ncbi:AAA family ATPase [Actinocrispum wychmicini]|uniref:Cobaltochelatase CobS n=1 Tax=Actinocrispum wychmicini TaxID=1213861 RepID=A0A4R2JRT2_9PSEU|nr:AAA family ATPase [Actinocrispum wychmicini]TCO56895.1 cobaltochelatase CobS [Actinocrispum wychmicini]